MVDVPKWFPEGKPIRLDPDAESVDASLPAFLAPPVGAPVYHGFPLLEETRTADGWCFGMISDPDCPEGRNWGDAYLVAPDDTRGGIVWCVGEPEFTEVCAPSQGRWGVYRVGIPRLVHSRGELVEQLVPLLPAFQQRYRQVMGDRAHE